MTELFPPPPPEDSRMTFRHEFNSGPLSREDRARLRTVQAVVASLERLVKTMGTKASVARHLDTSRPYLSMVLGGLRAPSDELARKLGYMPVKLYVRYNLMDGTDYGEEGREDAGDGDGQEGGDLGEAADEGTGEA